MLETPKPKSKRGPGAPSKRTVAVADRILLAVSKGVPFGHARTAGRHRLFNSLLAWRNEDGEFSERLNAAISAGIEGRLTTILECATPGRLESRRGLASFGDPTSDYGRQRLELSGPDGSPLAGTIAVLSSAKQDSNGGQLPAVTVPALTERSRDGNGD